MKTCGVPRGVKRNPRRASGEKIPNPSISTVFPAITPRNTIRATCWQASQHLGTPLPSLAPEGQPAAGSRPKAAQTRQPRLFPLAQAVEYFLNHPVQPVGRFAPCSARLAGHLFRNFRLLHSDFTLATEKWPEPLRPCPHQDNHLYLSNLRNRKKLKTVVNRT